ncbi:MAG: hypothetical protein VR64_22620 [Desulfatitalea sp. BRH_c12]|nr:MAG: hypothetical protein VR64_22620 [Desulfatitalea sp. BRH_c12]
MIDDQMKSNPSIGYLFVHNENNILAHTFERVVPGELVAANALAVGNKNQTAKIVNEAGERFVDVAWPILEGAAGTLRLGLSEEPFRHRIGALRVQISAITAAILLFSLLIAHMMIRRTTRQLVELTTMAETIDAETLALDFPKTDRDDEVERLAAAFRAMIERINDRTQRLKENADELERKNADLSRAQQQVRIAFEIVKHLGELPTLNETCSFLVGRLKSIINCRQIFLFLGAGPDRALMAFSEGKIDLIEGMTIAVFDPILTGIDEFSFVDPLRLSDLPVAELASAANLAVFPIRHEGQLVGAMCIGCPGQCQCVTTDIEVTHLVLNQSAGVIRRAVHQETEIQRLRHQIEKSAGYAELIGKDSQMQVIYKMIEDVAPSDATVLIQGESGTGKELVARAIHTVSTRKNNPFVVINCSAYPATLLESELFGYEKGAYTGAARQKKGRFEQADGGTVFLDEIGEISPTAQIKLLRVLQHRKFERLGGSATISVDVRILAATNRDLLADVKNGAFREDLYYRLKVIPITLPPLCKRKNDIPLLIRHFLARFAAIQKKTVKGISPAAMRALMSYAWPGNVRELENAIEHAIVLAHGDQIEIADIPDCILNAECPSIAPEPPARLEDSEKQHLIQVLEACNWNKTTAAHRLGIGRSTLYVKLRKYDIQIPSKVT